MLSFFGHYFYTKLHLLFPARNTDDQRKHFLASNLKLCEINWWKNVLVNSEINCFFLNCFSPGNAPKVTQRHPWYVLASLAMARYAWTNPTKSSKVICYLSLVNIPIHKIKDIDTLLPEIPMLKASCNLIGQEHFCPITCEPEFFQIKWFAQENRNVQCFKLLPENCNEKKLWKVKKPSIFVPILNPFCHFRANEKFSWKPTFITFFSFSKFLLLCRISEKNRERIPRIVTDVEADGRTVANVRGQVWIHWSPLARVQ